MKRLYGDSLHAHKHVPEFTEVAQVLKKRLGMYMENIAIDSEDLLALVSAASWVLILRWGVLMCGQRDPRSKIGTGHDQSFQWGGGTRLYLRVCIPTIGLRQCN